jgi:hypothetical protein
MNLLIEKVGEELRDMMPFLNAKKIKQESYPRLAQRGPAPSPYGEGAPSVARMT